MSTPNRRDFDKLALAALGGLLAGGVAGCGGGGGAAAAAEIHACRGLNECKGQGQGGGNACAGQGACATAKPHACGGENDCKHQGGCGEKPGFNDCKGKGGCSVPMSGDMWKSARELFEKQRKDGGKTFGEAPAKK